MTNEFAINILKQYREKPTLVNEIETVEEAVWLDEALEMAIKALEQEPSGETVSLEAFKQVKWERDIAIEQLKELGYGFGQKIESSGDLISRQAVHIELEKWITYGEYKYSNATKYLYDRIDRLPPVNPQLTKEEQALLQKWRDNRGISIEDFEDAMNALQEPKTEQEDDYFRKIVEVAISQLRADRDRLEDELAKREQEPKVGHWQLVSYGYGDSAYICECSECKDTIWVYKDADTKWNYCPNCGARMVDEQERSKE